MSKKGKEPSAQRFGGEFGPYRKDGTTGVSLGPSRHLFGPRILEGSFFVSSLWNSYLFNKNSCGDWPV